MFKRMHSIQTKLSLSYIIYILLFILLITIFSNILIQNQFKAYSTEKQEKQIAQIVSQVQSTYQDGWEVSLVSTIGNYILNEGYIIRVVDEKENLVWDANIHNGHQCDMVKQEIESRMYQLYPNWDNKFVKSNYTLYNGQNPVGTLQIEYYNDFYTEDDAILLTTLNQIYLYASIVFMLIGLVFASYLSKTLSRPIEKVVHASQMISKGIYDKIEPNISNIVEINSLTESISLLSTNLSNQEKIRKQLTQDVTHELRTPLTTLQTHIEAMVDGVLEPDVEQLRSVQEEIIRLTKIVADLDKLSRYDKQEMTLDIESININEMIHNVINIFKMDYQKKNVTLEVKSKAIEISADKDKLSQVFINLLSNALKYTPSNGNVTVEVIDQNKQVQIIITDTGLGIDEKDLPYIFERFYRADKSRNRETGGAGIGLTIVKSIILAHKGNIYAKSELNNGTKIVIELPKFDKNI